MLLPKQAISFQQLMREGFTKKKIKKMFVTLQLFPTPFKGIYYVPLEEERKGGVIESPLKIISQAIRLFLGSNNFYFSCETAEEALGLSWRPSGNIHVINEKLSRKIDLQKRIKRNNAKNNWRARKVAHVLSSYGQKIIFHRTSNVEKAKTRITPFGRFALKSQIKKDLRRFE